MHLKRSNLAKKNSGGQSKDGSSRTDSERRGSFSKGVNVRLDETEEERVARLQEELRQQIWQEKYKGYTQL